MTSSEIEKQVKDINEEIARLEKNKNKLGLEHIKNCISIINDIAWIGVWNGLSKESVQLMQTISVHLLNFMNGNVPNTFPDYSKNVDKVREIEKGKNND